LSGKYVGLARDPGVCRGKVFGNDSVVALYDFVAVLNGKDCQSVVKLAGAERNIVAHSPTLGDYLFGSRDPTDAQARQSEGLGDCPDTDARAAVIEYRRGEGCSPWRGQPTGRVLVS